ncbi:MAG: HEAT repeat domain-containing protein, partial [Planctomycetota bacterium]
CIDKLGNEAEAESATVALERIGKSAIPGLVKALKSPDQKVCFYAAITLGAIGDAEAVGPLIETLKHDVRLVRRAASQALSDITNEDLGSDYEKWKSWRDEGK